MKEFFVLFMPILFALVVIKPFTDRLVERIYNRFKPNFWCYNCKKDVHLLYRGKIKPGAETLGEELHVYQCPECQWILTLKKKI